MMRNNVQRLGEHVTAALLGRLTTPQPRERGDTAGGRRLSRTGVHTALAGPRPAFVWLRLPVERHADAAS